MLFLEIFDDYIDFTVSFQSTSTYQTLSESFKAHTEKSQYRIPSYILTDRVNVSTTMNRNNFNVKKILSRTSKSEVFTANVPFCPVFVIKKATTEENSKSAILKEIQLLTKMKHHNIIAILGSRISSAEPFIGKYSRGNMCSHSYQPNLQPYLSLMYSAR